MAFRSSCPWSCLAEWSSLFLKSNALFPPFPQTPEDAEAAPLLAAPSLCALVADCARDLLLLFWGRGGAEGGGTRERWIRPSAVTVVAAAAPAGAAAGWPAPVGPVEGAALTSSGNVSMMAAIMSLFSATTSRSASSGSSKPSAVSVNPERRKIFTNASPALDPFKRSFALIVALDVFTTRNFFSVGFFKMFVKSFCKILKASCLVWSDSATTEISFKISSMTLPLCCRHTPNQSLHYFLP
mmetsp:Transcript_8271/g.16102  ORF Transcript_8271/g.16102 Transcript_8271/m.16102 type:complete len:241 (+) Transcript_8271:1005-1727(+)